MWFQRFYLDKEKDMIVDLFREGERMDYVLSTPNHSTGNLIRNLARLCSLELSTGEQGLLVIRGTVPSYIDGYNHQVYVFRLGDTKVANIYPDGQVEIKAQIPAISKTLMSQTKDYRLNIRKTIVKTYILSEHKFRTDLHTHMNANLPPDLLIALGIFHQIRYPLYYIKKLDLRCTPAQWEKINSRRKSTEQAYAGSELTGKHLTRAIDDHTFLNFADLILNAPEHAAWNIPRIRRSLSIMKDGQAVFTNLEKVYLYRYVFTKGIRAEDTVESTREMIGLIPDQDILEALRQMYRDRENPAYKNNTLFQNKLLWIARSYASRGIIYAEISDTTLIKKDQAQQMLSQAHQVMPAITKETGVTLRFLAAIRRIPLTLVKDQADPVDYFRENLEALQSVAADPYVAGSDIVGEELNDIRDIRPLIAELVKISRVIPGFVLRIHAGENDGLRDNVFNSLQCVKTSLAPGQPMPMIRIGHGLYTADLNRPKGKALIQLIKECGAILEFQITSNVRLNNLSDMKNHPLRQYLSQGISCVQGTDGGALYGTDSMDEQLALEKMLGLSNVEMRCMRQAEEQALKKCLAGFQVKMAAWEAGERPALPSIDHSVSMVGKRTLKAEQVLKPLIRDLPQDMLPIVVAGGSFNQDRHPSHMGEMEKQRIDELLEKEDPQRTFFVIGHALRGCEEYLAAKNQGRFQVFAMVPAMISEAERRRIFSSGVSVRVALEPVPMGTYKSFAFEIFKRRPSVLIAFDGNIAGANLIQEAKNSKYPCRIYVNRRCKALKAKADTLEGYVTLFG